MDLQRNIELNYRKANVSTQSVPCTLSSEKPVDRGDYLEVLSHRKGNIDLSRAPLPLIESHNDQSINIGLVENLQTSDRKLCGTARFGHTQRAKELFADIEAGIVRNLSIGYQIFNSNEDNTTTPPTLHANRWQPFECSIVSIPADETVGFYRNKENIMENQNVDSDSTLKLTRSQRKRENKQREDEQNQLQNMRDLGKRFDCESLALKYIAAGKSQSELQESILDLVGKRNSAARTKSDFYSDYDLSPAHGPMDNIHEMIRSMAGIGDFDIGPWRERSQQITRQTGIKPRKGGMLIPLGQLKKRALTVASEAAGLVQTDILAGSFVDVLRAKSVIMNLNPTMLNNLVGNVSIPRKTAGTAGYWLNLDHTDSITESDITMDSVNLSMKSVAGYTRYSHATLVQSSLSIEEMIRQDLAATLASALDNAVLQGTGASNQPTGIINTNGVNTDTYTTAPNFADIVGMEGAILADNVELSNSVAYITTPTLATGLKTTEKATGTAQYIWTTTGSGEGLMNGYSAQATGHCPSDTVILGKWSDLLIGTWGAVEIVVDPYTDFVKGSVGIRAILDVDVAVRHPESFCVSTAA